MYTHIVNTKMIPVETTPGIGGGVLNIKGEWYRR
jgi:hypothetical protein